MRRLPDPDPDDPRRSAEQVWWPPVMLDPAWIERADFDVFHLQFGFDAWSPEQLRRRGRRDPSHGAGPSSTPCTTCATPTTRTAAHDAQLDVLVPAADALVTLTTERRDEIGERWGRTAYVVPHPHVVDFATMERFAAPRDRHAAASVSALHVKSLRASMDPEQPAADALTASWRPPPERSSRSTPTATSSSRAARATASRSRACFAREPRRVSWTSACTTSCPTPSCSTTSRRWTSPCFRTASARTPAGSRRAVTSARPWSRPAAATTRDQGPVLTYVNEEQHFDPDSLWRALDSARPASRPRTGDGRRAPGAAGRRRELPRRSLPGPAYRPQSRDRSPLGRMVGSEHASL